MKPGLAICTPSMGAAFTTMVNGTGTPLALKSVGLDESHASAADDEAWDIPLLQRMNEGLALVGDDVGTPIIALRRPDGTEVAAFGPVITKAPAHDDTLAMWDAFVFLTSLDEFWELKRTRTGRPEPGDDSLSAPRHADPIGKSPF